MSCFQRGMAVSKRIRTSIAYIAMHLQFSLFISIPKTLYQFLRSIVSSSTRGRWSRKRFLFPKCKFKIFFGGQKISFPASKNTSFSKNGIRGLVRRFASRKRLLMERKQSLPRPWLALSLNREVGDIQDLSLAVSRSVAAPAQLIALLLYVHFRHLQFGLITQVWGNFLFQLRHNISLWLETKFWDGSAQQSDICGIWVASIVRSGSFLSENFTKQLTNVLTRNRMKQFSPQHSYHTKLKIGWKRPLDKCSTHLEPFWAKAKQFFPPPMAKKSFIVRGKCALSTSEAELNQICT